MIRPLRALQLGIALGISLSSSASAEDEVRIALVSGASEVEVRGLRLALFDGEDGRRLWAFRERGSMRLARKGASVVARGLGPAEKVRYGEAPRLLIEADGALEVGPSQYYGRLEARPAPKGGVLLLNRLPLETYLLGIVGSEMPSSWPAEALKAQAVAARTYALQRLMMARAADQPHDLGATVLSQVYRGADGIQPSVIAAVEATRGQVLAYDRMLVEALFHSTCGGRTLSSKSYFGGERAYLSGRPCDWCSGSSRYRWEVKLKRQLLERKLVAAQLATPPIRRVLREGGWSHVLIEGGQGLQKVEPKAFRRAVGWAGLYSERFAARMSGDLVILEGRGFGHGVGMCQWGVKGLAEDGRTYIDILRFYYAGADVRRIY